MIIEKQNNELNKDKGGDKDMRIKLMSITMFVF